MNYFFYARRGLGKIGKRRGMGAAQNTRFKDDLIGLSCLHISHMPYKT
jgi:hypothetical protein